MSVVRVLCFVAVLHCMSASVLHHDFQKLGGPCPAAQDPCLNGGICTVTGSVTSCACVGGFNGLFCDAGPTPAPTAPPTGTTFRCTFEYGADPCFLSQETLDTFDWTFSKNVAASYRYGTGPNSASEGTSYAFIYASTSTPRSHGADAILISSILPMEDLCLTFDYHMYGYHMGSLSVLINDVSSAALNPTMRVLWTKSGDKGDIWHNAVIQIPATPSLRVSFEGIVGGFTSDAAIDNVVLGPGYCGCSPSPCQNGGTCSEDALGQISCTCIPDFTGGLCETLGGSLHCSFEDCAHCFLHQDQHDDFDWSIISGSTPCLDTGPSSAFEGNKYAFIEATGPRIQYEIAEFYVDLGTNSAQRCLSFAYHMYGIHIGSLKISHLDGQQVVTLWSQAGNQGNNWETASVQIPAMNNGQIYITGVHGDGWSGDIAIDDVELKTGTCGCLAMPCRNGGTCTNDNAVGFVCTCVAGFTGVMCESPDGSIPVTCTFEDGASCFLEQIKAGLDMFDWTINQGSTPSVDTGPSSAFEGNKYAFIDASSFDASGSRIRYADIAQFYVDLGTNSAQRCLSFAYHMYGSDIGILKISHLDGQQVMTLWSRAGKQGNHWETASVQIPAMNNGQIYITGVRGDGWSGDIAIDDVELKTGTCGCLAMPCRNGGTCTNDNNAVGFVCTCVAGFTGIMCESPDGSIPVTCTFEDGASCFLEQIEAGVDMFDWTINQGSTSSPVTGPSSAFEGNKYAFIDASGPRIEYDIAQFYVDLGTNSAQCCLSFAYHMYGFHIGSLEISHLDSQQVMTLWSRAGKQGNNWETASVQIPAMNNGQIYITGVRGDGSSGDIAIDDVELKTGTCGCSAMPCRNGGTCTNDNAVGFVCTCVAGFTGVMCESPDGSIPVTCTFEDGASCFLEQVKPKVDTFDWTIKQGYSSSTPSPGSWYDDTWPFPIHDTGPSSAFEGNKYAFIEATGPRIQYEIAEFYVDLGTNSAQCCLSFAYHMYGSDIGSLEISHLDGQQVMTLWSRAGNQGNNWETASVRIPAMNNGQIYITGVRGDGSSGDIAIDDVELKTGTCGSVPGTCTFEDGAYCFLEQVNAAVDSFDWTINQGGTPSSNTGPDNAHTGSKYAFIEASSPRISGDNAILSSEQTTFLPMNRCLQFYFHMKGNSIGDLIVLSGERGSETTVWSLSGAQGNDWVYTEVSLPTAADLVIAIEGVRGSDWRGDIAIDDLELNAGLC
ncbi:MAM and LDL-receptor class A domain-containing protein 1-like isoform X2 [Mizuhopecten yessoensis]|uniref:MAM and LDL-receptor class A domain-containing protein 1-like isoform X2 n=1 Tax=Mizuhopecten yessoensis TaxID=6573 RepID=UPI000B45B786|nr:MAM and LDL-receptor class A domain-containing protein 1-like isoform X2 [Mizuhopecten yessoensis]